ncbi:unnamed protein product [Heterosigma akashiwo]
MAGSTSSQKKHPLMHLIAGGSAGLVESTCCHPLDTIKTRMQLTATTNHYTTAAGGSTIGPLQTATRIVANEGLFSLYKGLTAVWAGIIPKMMTRFTSFEMYKDFLRETPDENLSKGKVLLAGLGSGVTEAILVVTPAEVCKIRMQMEGVEPAVPRERPSVKLGQFIERSRCVLHLNTQHLANRPFTSHHHAVPQSHYHSMMDPAAAAAPRKYRNVFQAAAVIVREEGPGALYKGVVPTTLRQGCNQAVNFTCYQTFKERWLRRSGREELAPWQHMLIGGLSGGFGPAANNPLDVVKTRLQKQRVEPGQRPKYTGLGQAVVVIAKEEGVLALWKGLTPRLMRIMPGQAITFMTYEFVSKHVNKMGLLSAGPEKMSAVK